MKLVLNKCFGGFNVPKALEEIGYDYKCKRTDPQLIKWVEKNINKKHYDEDNGWISNCDFGFTSLRIVEIPDEATSYYINDYDGFENVFYVIDGEIVRE